MPDLDSIRVLECVLCKHTYSRADILRGLYRLDSMVCSYCYAAMQQQPAHESCFGKPTVYELSGRVILGYDEKASDCKTCPDRAACRSIVIGGTDHVYRQHQGLVRIKDETDINEYRNDAANKHQHADGRHSTS